MIIFIHLVLKMILNSFSNKDKFKLKIIKNFHIEDLYKCAYDLVHYGWKKEAVPIIQEKKSIVARIFDVFFK